MLRERRDGKQQIGKQGLGLWLFSSRCIAQALEVHEICLREKKTHKWKRSAWRSRSAKSSIIFHWRHVWFANCQSKFSRHLETFLWTNIDHVKPVYKKQSTRWGKYLINQFFPCFHFNWFELPLCETRTVFSMYFMRCCILVRFDGNMCWDIDFPLIKHQQKKPLILILRIFPSMM